MEKQSNDIIIHPQRAKGERTIPKQGVFFVNPADARFAMDMLLQRGGERRFLFHSGLVISADNMFFVAGPSVGAPMAVMSLEKLIVLGAEQVVMGGWCGSLDTRFKVGEYLVGGTPHSGEGTSRYYCCERSVEPSADLVKKLQHIVQTPVASGAFWSTDAPYRESRAMFAALVKEYQIAGVDMEYSALCSVAAFREIDFAGLFLVSDELFGREWSPGFSGKGFKKKCHRFVEQLLEVFVR